MRVGASCLCVLPMTGTDSRPCPGPLSQRLLGGPRERQALGWGHAHALFPGLEGWLRLEYSDTPPPGDLGGGKAAPHLPSSVSLAHGAHRLLRATLGSAWGFLPGPAALQVWGRSGPRWPSDSGLQSPCLLQVGLGPHSRPSCSARAHGSYAQERQASPGRWGSWSLTRFDTFDATVPAGLQPCQSLCPLPVTR